MKGYEVVSHEDEKVIGHVVDKVGKYYLVEHGALRKSTHALPEEFVRMDEGAERLVITIPKELLYDSPKVDGTVDEDAVAVHYGLTDTSVDDSPPYIDREVVEERISAYEGVEDTDGIRESPALLGDRYDDTVVERGKKLD